MIHGRSRSSPHRFFVHAPLVLEVEQLWYAYPVSSRRVNTSATTAVHAQALCVGWQPGKASVSTTDRVHFCSSANLLAIALRGLRASLSVRQAWHHRWGACTGTMAMVEASACWALSQPTRSHSSSQRRFLVHQLPCPNTIHEHGQQIRSCRRIARVRANTQGAQPRTRTRAWRAHTVSGRARTQSCRCSKVCKQCELSTYSIVRGVPMVCRCVTCDTIPSRQVQRSGGAGAVS